MKKTIQGLVIVAAVMAVVSCQDTRQPNYQYMPNMYESVGYETYQPVDWLPGGSEALLPAEHTVARGKMPYRYANTLEGREMARTLESPLDSLNREENLAIGKELYGINCAICHGNKGDGQGNLVKREKILGVPSYADAGRNITVGSTHHVIYYGLNAMGSYANQLNAKERWQVSEYVMKLKEDLTQ
ncbi:c-type cytochrome [Robiginitalea sp. M366]|uniref:c-type cytochrome n=1 Tax=Robiginitalea aestuariiviva TaxID=3036903 RepID=UPI00240D8697|nr:c-type cytochrome [Robiginitalea aestuariiviva]MDG1571022.1 c-type cytochrome [Robiginitalea aestuariiviva]